MGISENLQFPDVHLSRYLYTSLEISPLREAKNGENRAKIKAAAVWIDGGSHNKSHETSRLQEASLFSTT